MKKVSRGKSSGRASVSKKESPSASPGPLRTQTYLVPCVARVTKLLNGRLIISIRADSLLPDANFLHAVLAPSGPGTGYKVIYGRAWNTSHRSSGPRRPGSTKT